MKRVIAVVVAVAMVAIGTVLLVGYVKGAEDRALEGQELVSVLVVDEPIERGSPAEDLASSVREIQLPVKARADHSVSSLRDVDGQVAAVDLVPGEQLISTRFTTPEEFVTQTLVDVPSDLLQVTVALEPARAVGGQVVPGDQVAVIASFEPFEFNGIEPTDLKLLGHDLSEFGLTPEDLFQAPGEEEATEGSGELSGPTFRTPNTTHIVIHNVMVTNVQVEKRPAESDEETDRSFGAPELAPTGKLLITLAGEPEDVERIVFTMEHGFLWLALEGDDVAASDTEIQTRGTIYR